MQFYLGNKKGKVLRVKVDVNGRDEEIEYSADIIQHIPPGHRTEATSRELTDRAPVRPGVRCIICDWAPQTRRVKRDSLSNPEMAEYKKSKLIFDHLTGKPICSECERATAPFRDTYASQWRASREMPQGTSEYQETERLRNESRAGNIPEREAEQKIKLIEDRSWARYDLAKSGTSRKKLAINPDFIRSTAYTYEDAFLGGLDIARSKQIEDRAEDDTNYEESIRELFEERGGFQRRTEANDRHNELALYTEGFVGSQKLGKGKVLGRWKKNRQLWNEAERIRRRGGPTPRFHYINRLTGDIWRGEGKRPSWVDRLPSEQIVFLLA